MWESKGLAPNVLRGGALGWKLLCLSWKRIMSGTQCQGYHIYEILWVLWMIFKVLGKIITYVFSLIQGKGRNLAPMVVYQSGKGSWHVHSSLFFPCSSKYHTHSNSQLQGSRWGVQINSGEKWWKSGGWKGRRGQKGGLPGVEGKPHATQ